MTREEIIKLAREAGEYASVEYERAWKSGYGASWQQIRDERFAALVAAAERTRLHDKFMEIHKSQQHSNNYWHFAARKIKEEA